mmetsp:Transcript_17717/g.35978  ORF Transcript_17717/g.35978 Transcript_17717/m.35978 type:complete len:152 (-) Transcript_17717:2921-3376(-)
MDAQVAVGHVGGNQGEQIPQELFAMVQQADVEGDNDKPASRRYMLKTTEELNSVVHSSLAGVCVAFWQCSDLCRGERKTQEDTKEPLESSCILHGVGISHRTERALEKNARDGKLCHSSQMKETIWGEKCFTWRNVFFLTLFSSLLIFPCF